MGALPSDTCGSNLCWAAVSREEASLLCVPVTAVLDVQIAVLIMFLGCLAQQTKLSCLWVVLCVCPLLPSVTPLRRTTIRPHNVFIEIEVLLHPVQVAVLHLLGGCFVIVYYLVRMLPAICLKLL